MKTFRNILIGIAVILFAAPNVAAQYPSLDFVYGSTYDAKLLLQEYMRPYANILGANLNGGWYNTAEAHKPGGLDITFTVSVAFAPPTALTYDLSAFSDDLVGTVTGASTVAPTVAGDMETRPALEYSAGIINPTSGLTETFPLATIHHPNGIGYNFLPLPMAQLSVGLIKGTDITLRYMPTMELRDLGNVGVWGIGGKHVISQWIPVLKRLKFINIAVQGGYTNVNTMARLSMEPNVEVEPADHPQWIDQEFHLNAAGWTVNLIASQSIPVITVYEGIGYSSSIVDMSLMGHFPIYGLIDEEGANYGKTTYKVSENPIEDLSFENYNKLRLNAGIRFKLGLITLHYDFTKTLYATHTAGIGVSFR